MDDSSKKVSYSKVSYSKVSYSKVSYAGEIRLSFINRGGRTIADRMYRRGNSRVSANIPVAGDIPYYFLISTGGGYTEGESYLQQVSLGDDTHVILTTQTPNYVYKCERGLQTSQKNLLDVGDDCMLEYYIDETIPYARALFSQYTEIRLGKGSSVILTDGLTGGWSGDEKPFQYGRIGIRTKIMRGDELLLNDHLLVDPREEPMKEIGYFEGNLNYNSAVIIDPEMDAAKVKAMREHLQALSTPCRYGLSLLEKEGAVLRVLGESAYKNREVIWTWIRYYREQMKGFAPLDLRKGAGR